MYVSVLMCIPMLEHMYGGKSFNSSQQLWQQRPSPVDLYLANAQYLNLKMIHPSIMLTSGWTCLACPLNRFESTGSVPSCVSVRRAPERCSFLEEERPTLSVDRGPGLLGSEPSISNHLSFLTGDAV